MSVKIFISHKKEDSRKAEKIAKYIKEQFMFDVYIDTLDDSIIRTTDITERIVTKLRGSTHLLVLFSEHTIKSMWVPFELGVSYERQQGIGVLIWPDGININYNLPEYLNAFPKLKCYKKNIDDVCQVLDLDKYLNEIKKYPTKSILVEAMEAESFSFRKTASEVNYAREFIDRLNRKLH